MLTRRTETLMKSLDLMLEAVINGQKSHEYRNKELAVIRVTLDNWLKDFNRYTSQEDEKSEARQTFEALYQLCIWTLEHETHHHVKNRLYLARSVIAQYFQRVNLAREIERAEYRNRATKPVIVDSLEFEHVSDDLVPVIDDESVDDLPF